MQAHQDGFSRGRSGASLELRNVSKSFGGVQILDRLSLSVQPGEFVTLLGPSGSGKTTTLGAIAGFVFPDSGDVLLEGHSIASLQTHKRNLGMVFQHYALFPHMSVFDNIAFPLRQRKVAKDALQRAVNEVLELVQLSDRASYYPKQLSGGQQQRVALARAVVYRPRVLLMDEPLGALDKKLREALQSEIRRIHRELGITFIYVTHDQEEALALSDRIVLFENGKIAQMGTGTDLYERPQSRFVAQFLGEANILDGRLNASGDALQVGDGVPIKVIASAGLAGNDASLIVRPEKVRVGEAGGGQANAFLGTIISIVYLGATRRLEVEVDKFARPFSIRMAVEASDANFYEGQIVSLFWEIEDSRLVAAA
jgi:putative spermidine/putrescine transport system ATP-binding protein